MLMKTKANDRRVQNIGNCLGFIGTLAMSFSMIPAPEGNGMMLDGIGKTLTPFALIRYGWLNQIGLTMIGIGFFLPFFLRAPRWGKWLMLLVVVPLYGGLIYRFA